MSRSSSVMLTTRILHALAITGLAAVLLAGCSSTESTGGNHAAGVSSSQPSSPFTVQNRNQGQGYRTTALYNLALIRRQL